jgi:beta-glucosidase
MLHLSLPLRTSPNARRALAGLLLYAGAAAAWAQDPRGTAHPLAWPEARSPVAVSAPTAALVERLLSAMTLEEKVGQLLQADIDSVKPEDVRRYHLGSVLAGGNAAPDHDLRASAQQWQALIRAYADAALADSGAQRPAVPILFGIDAVHGNARITGATVFPHNVGLGAMHDPRLLQEIGRATADEVSALGADWTFAPDVAVVRDVRWGRSYESYSEDPALVAAYARAMVTGLQGTPGTGEFMGPARVLASVKHFIGDGSTLGGRDQFDSHADEDTLRTVHGAGFVAAIEAGALNVMASYNGWQGVKMHANASLLSGVLKGRWSFPGFVVGDWNAQEEIPGCSAYDCPALLMAGVDMYMAPDSWKRLYAHLLAEGRSGAITAMRLDDAVRRILTVKALMHRLGASAAASRPVAADLERLGSPEHRAIARQAVRESLVLLKNNHQLLPLDPHGSILVAGAAADSIGDQCGGWTIDWQGDHNTNADFPGATSIYAGIRAAVEAAGGHAVLSADGSFGERPTAAIVIFGEGPYAEFEGDRETLALSDANAAHLQVLRRLHAAGVPIVGVFLSGRPLWINRELNLADALIAAWLPGSEGGGIADLMFKARAGAPRPDFTGRLSFSWPRTAQPVRFAADGTVSGALFARGFGLSLASHSNLPPQPEDPGMQAHNPRDSLFAAGHVTAPWSVYVEDPTATVRLTMQQQPSPRQALVAEVGDGNLRGTWSGNAVGELRIGGRAADFRARVQEGDALVLSYRVTERPTQTVTLGIRCEAPYGTRPPRDATAPVIDWRLCDTRNGAGVDITRALQAAAPGSWQSLTVPLRCMSAAADLRYVNAPFAVATSGRLTLDVREVRLAHANAACPAGDAPQAMVNLIHALQ